MSEQQNPASSDQNQNDTNNAHIVEYYDTYPTHQDPATNTSQGQPSDVQVSPNLMDLFKTMLSGPTEQDQSTLEYKQRDPLLPANRCLAILDGMEKGFMIGATSAAEVNTFRNMKEAYRIEVCKLSEAFLHRSGFRARWEDGRDAHTNPAHDIKIFDIVELIDAKLLDPRFPPSRPMGTSTQRLVSGAWLQVQHRYGILTYQSDHLNLVSGMAHGYTSAQLADIPDDDAKTLGVLVNEGKRLPDNCSQYLTRIDTIGRTSKEFVVVDLTFDATVKDGTPIKKAEGMVLLDGRIAISNALRAKLRSFFEGDGGEDFAVDEEVEQGGD